MAAPPPSEWGKLSRGQSFEILATDIKRALFGVRPGWGTYELLLIGYVMETSWGTIKTKRIKGEWPDPAPCLPNFHALSKDWQVPCQRLYEARDTLAAKKVLLVGEDGLWINKNAHEWVDPKTGKPLLSARMLAYSLSGRSRKQSTDENADCTPEREFASQRISRPSVKHDSIHLTPQRELDNRLIHAPACNDFTPQREISSPPSVKFPQLPIDEARASAGAPDQTTTRESSKSAVSRAGAGGHSAESQVTPFAPNYPGDEGIAPLVVAPNSLAEDEVRELFGLSWVAFSHERLSRDLYLYVGRHSYAAWKAAIAEGKRRQENGTVKIRGLGYIETIAADLEENAKREPVKGKSRTQPTQPPSRYADTPFHQSKPDPRKPAMRSLNAVDPPTKKGGA